MMATLRHLTELDAGVRAGRWSSGAKRLYELWSSTIGIVGMGRIGQEVAQRLAGWGSTLIYHDPVRLPPERERDLGVAFASLDDLLAPCGRGDRARAPLDRDPASDRRAGARTDEADGGPGQHRRAASWWTKPPSRRRSTRGGSGARGSTSCRRSRRRRTIRCSRRPTWS